MRFWRDSSSDKNLSITLILGLLSSLLVLLGPIPIESQANYTSYTAYSSDSAIGFNNQICELGDPNNHSTSDVAFQISTAEQLWEITDCVSTSATIFFELSNDVDVNQAASAPTHSPIGRGSSSTKFNGVLDGKNYKVHGVSMSASTLGVGLFNELSGATISNLVIAGVFFTSDNSTSATRGAGSLAVRASGEITLISISNEARVSGRYNVGGLVGRVDGNANFYSSRNTGHILSEVTYAGGLVGYISGSANFSNSSNLGSVTGVGGHAGGLAGRINTNASFTASHNVGEVTASNDYAGGLVGSVRLNVDIATSGNTASVSSSGLYAGGLIGRTEGEVSIASSENSGATSGTSNVGGLIGRADGDLSITLSRSIGSTSATATDFAGGLVGYAGSNASITSSHNVGRVSSNRQHVGGLIGRVLGDANVHSSHNSGNISGTNYIGGLIGYATKDANITASSNIATVAASDNYAGGLVGAVFDNANLHSSSNSGQVSASSNYAGGLVGYVDEFADIRFSQNTATVSADTQWAGGLAGYVKVDAEIASSFNSGNISGGTRVGGLAGSVFRDISITSSFNTGAIFGDGTVGGLAGQVVGDANMGFAFNTGPVSSSGAWAGGLVAYVNSDFDLVSSYNTGSVVGSSNFDGMVGFAANTPTTNGIYSSEPTSLVTTTTLADMKIASTYVDFNFTDVWGFGSTADNQGLPMLRAFNQVDSFASDEPFALSSNSALASIALSHGTLTPTFASSTPNYSATVSNAVTTITVAPTTDDAGASMTVNGTSVISGNVSNAIALTVGQNTIAIIVTAADSSTTGYSLSITRAALSSNSALASIAIDQGVLTPTFGSATTSYTASVSNAVSSVTLTPAAEDAGASITVNGIAVISGNASNPINLTVGQNTITTIVTAADSSTTVYVFAITRVSPPPIQSTGSMSPAAPNSALNYAGPVLDAAASAEPGTQAYLSGSQLHYVTRVYAGGIQIPITRASSESLVLSLPEWKSPGTYDLVLVSKHGTLTMMNGLSVLNSTAISAETKAGDGKLTLGSFNGVVAIYTKGYEGQRLSAKVAGKWIVVESIDESFKGNDYSRTARRAESGYSIKVHLYIDREFVRTEELTTK